MVYTKAGLWILLAGIVLMVREADSLRGSALVAELKAKAKAALNNPTETVEEVVTVEGDAGSENVTTNVTVVKKKSLLTGIPQIDYIYDPNLPRELNGYNLSSYPFYNGVPENITFKCDDLHDGFYASVPHKCQVYHHCLFGTRYDFLCANYTAFDQTTFICHFVSEVDCDNSPKYYKRNEALYKWQTTTSAPIVLQTTTTTTSAPPPASGGGDGATQRPRRRRPYRRRRPVYEYYYDDQYDDDEYYDDDPPPPPPPPRRKMNRKHRPIGGLRDEEDEDYHDTRRGYSRGESSRGESSRGEGSRGGGFRGESNNRGNNFRGENEGENSKEAKPTLRVSGPASGTIYDQPRVPPKVRRPVPLNEREKYDYNLKNSDPTQTPTQDPKKSNKEQTKLEEDDEEYYDDEYEDDFVKPPPKRSKQGSTYSSDSGEKVESRRPSSRNRPRQHSQRRPDRHEDDYEEKRPARPRKKSRHEDSSEISRGNRGGNKGYTRDEPNPVPAERPGYISSSRHSTGNRKRTEDSGRGQTTKRPSRVTYDDEEDEEEYYDYEEEPEEGLNRRNNKSKAGGRRNEERESENERGSQRKTNTESSIKTNLRPQATTNNQRDSGKMSTREYEPPLSKKRPSINQCRDDCEEDYLDESYDDMRAERKPNSHRDNLKQDSKDDPKQISERDKLFSSRFRDPVIDVKNKQENIDHGKGSLPLTSPKTATQQPEITQRYKPSLRARPSMDEQFFAPKQTSTSTAQPSEDYSELSSTVSNKYLNFRPKGRITSSLPLYNNPKTFSTTEKSYEVSEIPELNNPYDERDSDDVLPERALVSQRPINNAGKQYANKNSKSTTEAVFQEDSVSSRQPSVGLNYRQPSLTNEGEDKLPKPTPPSQNYRRFKPEPLPTENVEYTQPKNPYIGTNFRRPGKPVEEVRSENVAPVREREEYRNTDDNMMKVPRNPLVDRSQPGTESYGGSYRRVKISAMTTSAPEVQQFTQSLENVQSYQATNPSYQGAPNLSPVNSYKRPYIVGKPINNNYPDNTEETTKNTLPLGNNYRRPVKNRIQYTEPLTSVGDFTSTSAVGGVSDSYSKGESAPGTNLRQSSAYFPPKRVKIQIDDSTGRGLEQFSNKQPKIEITAPGPSAPDIDLATVKSKNYNSQPRFPLDIPEEEYDVTLNDALQPSTLHPTRSLVDYQQARLKTRDYPPNLERSSEYVNRGRVAYLLPAASQQHITKVQSVFLQDKQEETPITSRHSDRNLKKPSSIDQEEYEAVVLSASSDQWPNQRRNRPTEWYW